MRAAAVIALLVAGCSVAPPVPSTPLIPASSPATTSTAPASADATTLPGPSATSLALPDGLNRFAWRTARAEVDAASNRSTHLSAGWLGSTASLTETVDWKDGFVRVFNAGAVLAIVTYRTKSAAIDLRGVDGARLGRVELPDLADLSLAELVLDPARSVVYAAVAVPAGGVEIRRVGFDGRASSTLLTLDARFTPEGIPTERYGLTLGPDGTLVVIACGKADGCRLWQVGPAEVVAKAPVRLPANTPIVCSVVGATHDWLLVSDDEVCYADTGEAPLPIRAISLRDGASRVLANDHVITGRILDVGGRAVVVVSVRSDHWSMSDIVTIDVASRERRTVLAGLRNSNNGDSGWLGVSPLALVGPWVLIAPWGVDEDAAEGPPNAWLLNLETRQVIELPAGTFGWD